MSRALEMIRGIVTGDLSSEYVRTMSIEIGWGYARLYEELLADGSLPVELKVEEFGRRRGAVVSSAMIRACEQHGVPYALRRLDCNGQSKLLVQAGRVVLMQEPILSLEDAPRTSDYKAGLADAHGIIRQLELDLGDQPKRIIDWSGSVLAVVLHGARGSGFSRQNRMLGGLLLAVPDASYTDWVMRLDLYNAAMFGAYDRSSETPQTPSGQADAVVVRRRKLPNTGTEE